MQTFLIGFLIHLNQKQRKIATKLQEYEERYRELIRVDRTSRLGELTASLAHELNQPLTAILALRRLDCGLWNQGRTILHCTVRYWRTSYRMIRGLPMLSEASGQW